MIPKNQLNQTNKKENLAEEELLAISQMTTLCKEIITEGLTSGQSQEIITNQLNIAIAKNVKLLPIDLQEEARKTMVRSCRKWYFELSQSLNIYARNLSNQLGINLVGKPHKVIIDEFRPYLDAGNNVAVPMIKDYQANVKSVLKTLSSQTPEVIKRNEGQSPYKVSLRNRAEMRVRFEANMQDVERLKDSGVKLVWTSSHPNCSPRCKDYQGKLWSLDGTSGTINGKKYQPIEIAMRGKNNDGNGIISGYNCRHRLVEYTGQPAPNDYTEAEIKKEYAIDQRQRAYENKIRQLKVQERLERASGNIKDAKKLKKQWQRYTDRYKIYSMKNNRAFYPWRCVVSDDEKTPTQQTTQITSVKPSIEEKVYKTYDINSIKQIYKGDDKLIETAFNLAHKDKATMKILNNLHKLPEIKIKKGKKANFLPSYNELTIKNSKDIDAFYHEFGHSIDNLVAFKKDYTDEKWQYNWFSEKLNDVRNKTRETINNEIPISFVDIMKKEKIRLIEHIKETYVNTGKLNEDVKISIQKKYGEKWNSLSNVIKNYSLNEERQKILNKYIDTYQKEDSEFKKWGALSDILDAVSSGNAKNSKELIA